jgi:tRNA(Ile)-lysidine synthetase-like protein
VDKPSDFSVPPSNSAHLRAIVWESLKRCRLTSGRLVVAVSGGADSLALLLALIELRQSAGVDLVIAHLDHQLRPESAADAEHVRALARTLDVAAIVDSVDVRRVAREQSLGLEEAARVARYRFLGDMVVQQGALAVLVGHTAADQTETRVLHLVRGSGLRGLVGMTEDSLVSPGAGRSLRVIRPLLAVSRRETEEFCRIRGLTPRVDPSNLDRAFTRNRIRHEILPQLWGINPAFDEALGRLARAAADADAFLEGELVRRLPELVRVDAERWTIDRRAWRELPAALQRALLRRAAATLGPTDVGAAAIEAGLAAASSGHAGTVIDWSAGRQLVVDSDRVVVQSTRSATAPRRPVPVALEEAATIGLGPLPAALVAPGEPLARISRRSAVLQTRLRSATCPERTGDRWHADLDRGTLFAAGSLVVRSRTHGDWLQPEGMTGRKKVQDVLVDARIPRADRDVIPVLATASGLVWLVGLRRDRRFVAGPDCTDVLCLTVDFPDADPTG